MITNDFITIGGQLIARTGSGDLQLMDWPTESAFNMVDEVIKNPPDRMPGRVYQYQKLIKGGGDLINLKDLSDAERQKIYQEVRNKYGSNTMFHNIGHRSDKVANTWRQIASKIKGVAPMIAGFSSVPGAIASGLLYAGTAKKLHAPTLDYQLDRPGNILDTPITAYNRNLHDQVGVVDTSLGPMDGDSGFDRYMQNKIQNLRNTQGIMGARADRDFTQTDYGKAYNRGGIVSLV